MLALIDLQSNTSLILNIGLHCSCLQVKIVETDTHKHSPTDLARRFVLSYFMMDDSIQIFEQPVRNSGIAGGKFLERQKVRYGSYIV